MKRKTKKEIPSTAESANFKVEDYPIHVNRNHLYRFSKRCFDVVFSLLSIIVLLIPMFIILLIQILVTKGHPIFIDRRVGKNGKIIPVFKFRSMYKDAESNIASYLNEDQKKKWESERKINHDPRITPFGHFLRKSSLDELPQFFNVLIGNMSLVGYRPMSVSEVENHFTENQRKAMSHARPGLTGYWQVYGRGKALFETGERQKMIFYYLEHRSVHLDLKLLLLTVVAVAKANGED